jgi:hypothetical protein
MTPLTVVDEATPLTQEQMDAMFFPGRAKIKSAIERLQLLHAKPRTLPEDAADRGVAGTEFWPAFGCGACGRVHPVFAVPSLRLPSYADWQRRSFCPNSGRNLVVVPDRQVGMLDGRKRSGWRGRDV